MEISSEMEAARADLRARRQHFYRTYAALQALVRNSMERVIVESGVRDGREAGEGGGD